MSIVGVISRTSCQCHVSHPENLASAIICRCSYIWCTQKNKSNYFEFWCQTPCSIPISLYIVCQVKTKINENKKWLSIQIIHPNTGRFSLLHTGWIKRKDSPGLLTSHKKHIMTFSHKSGKHCLLSILNQSIRLNIVTNIASFNYIYYRYMWSKTFS